MKKLLLLTLFIATSVLAKELPSWGMTESQYKMPNFVTKMQKIGDQAVANNWLLKITAPKDWHNKIRAALSSEGANNVQINFNDSLYKSIAITAAPGMELKSTSSEAIVPGVVRKQVVIEKPEMDTQIDAPEFDKTSFKADDILADMGEIKLTLPDNGHVINNSTKTEKSQQSVKADESNVEKTGNMTVGTNLSDEQSKTSQSIKEDLRMRYARGKTVDNNINFSNITTADDLFVEGDTVLVKRYLNRGVAVYYWMAEAYDPVKHKLIDKGSGKYVKSSEDSDSSLKSKNLETVNTPIQNPKNDFFDFVAVTDDQNTQDQLRRDYIRNKTVSNTLKASQLKSQDILYVSGQTVLVERPLGNARSAYFWLQGETDIQQAIEHKGPNKFLIQ